MFLENLVYKKSITTSLIMLIIIILSSSAFATIHKPQAFLGTTFRMSPIEVEKVLQSNNTRLISHDEFESLDSVKFLKNKFFFWGYYRVPDYDDETLEHWYTPPIKMFDSSVATEFEFINNKLMEVEVIVCPTKSTQFQQIADQIESQVKKNYNLISKEYEDKKSWNVFAMLFRNIPKTYSVTLKSDVTKVHMRIDYQNQTIHISLQFNDQDYENMIKSRQEKAFNGF